MTRKESGARVVYDVRLSRSARLSLATDTGRILFAANDALLQKELSRSVPRDSERPSAAQGELNAPMASDLLTSIWRSLGSDERAKLSQSARWTAHKNASSVDLSVAY